LSKPTLAKIEEEFNFEISTKGSKNSINKIEKLNDESKQKIPNELEKSSIRKEHPISSKTQLNDEEIQEKIAQKHQTIKSNPINYQRKNSFNDELEGNSEDKVEEEINEFKKSTINDKEIKINKFDIHNLNEITTINNSENKSTSSKEESKALVELNKKEENHSQPQQLEYLTKKQLKKYKKNKTKENEELSEEIGTQVVENELKANENGTSNEEILTSKLIEDKKINQQSTEAVQENEEENLLKEATKEENTNENANTKKIMNKRQLKRQRKIQNDNFEDEIQQSNTVEEKETVKNEEQVLESNEVTSIKVNDQILNEEPIKNEKRLTKKQLRKQKQNEKISNEILNESLDLEPDNAKSHGSDNFQNLEPIISEKNLVNTILSESLDLKPKDEKQSEHVEEKNDKDDFIQNVKPLKKEKNLTKKQLKKLKQNERLTSEKHEEPFMNEDLVLKIEKIEPKVDEEKVLDEKKEEEKALKEKALREKALEEKVLKEKALEEKALREKALEEKALKEKALKEKALEEKALKEKALKEKALKEKALKEKALEEKALKEKALEEKALKEKALEEKALKEKALEEKILEEKALKEKALEEKEEEIKTFEPTKSGKKLTKAQMKRLKKRQGDKADDDEISKIEIVDNNNVNILETEKIDLLIENEVIEPEINFEKNKNKDNIIKIEKEKDDGLLGEKSDPSKDTIEKLKKDETTIKSKKKMSKSQLKKLRKERENENSEDEVDQEIKLMPKEEDKTVEATVKEKSFSLDNQITNNQNEIEKSKIESGGGDFPALKSKIDDSKKDEMPKNEKWSSNSNLEKEKGYENLDVNSYEIKPSKYDETVVGNQRKNEKPLTKKQLRKQKLNEIKFESEIKPEEEINDNNFESDVKIEQFEIEYKINQTLNEIIKNSNLKDEIPSKEQLKQNLENSNEISYTEIFSNNNLNKNDSAISINKMAEHEIQLNETSIDCMNKHENEKPLIKSKSSEFRKIIEHFDKELDKKELKNETLKAKLEIKFDPEKSDLKTILQTQKKIFKSKIPIKLKPKKALSESALRSDFNEKKSFFEKDQSHQELHKIPSIELKSDESRQQNNFKFNNKSENSLNGTAKLKNNKERIIVNVEKDSASKAYAKTDNSNEKIRKNVNFNEKLTYSFIGLDYKESKKENRYSDESFVDYKEHQKAFSKSMTKSSEDWKNLIMNSNSDLIENKLPEETKTRSHSLDGGNKENLFETSRAFFKEMENKLAEEKKPQSPSKKRLSFRSSNSKNELNCSFNENIPKQTENSDSEVYKIKIVAQNIEQSVHFNPLDSFNNNKKNSNLDSQTESINSNDIQGRKEIQIKSEGSKINPWNIKKLENSKETSVKKYENESGHEEVQYKKSPTINFNPWNLKNDGEKEEQLKTVKDLPDKKSFNDLRKLFDANNQDQETKPNFMFKRHSSYGEKNLKKMLQENFEKKEDISIPKRNPLLEKFYQNLMNNKKSYTEEAKQQHEYSRPVRRAASLSEEIAKEKKVENQNLNKVESENLKIIKLEKEIKDKLKNITATSSEEEVKGEVGLSNIFKIKQQIGKKLEANLKHDLTKIIKAPLDKNTSKSSNDVSTKSYEIDKSIAQLNEEDKKILEAKKNCNLKINLLFNSKPLDQNDMPKSILSHIASLQIPKTPLDDQKKETQPLQEFNIESSFIEVPPKSGDIIYSTKKFQKSDDSQIKNYFETLTRDYNKRFDKYFGEKQSHETSSNEESADKKKTLAYFLKFDEPQVTKKKNENLTKEKKKSKDIFENYVKFDLKSDQDQILKPTSSKKKISKKKVKFNLDVINHEPPPPPLDTDESIEDPDIARFSFKESEYMHRNPKGKLTFRNDKSFSSNESNNDFFKNEQLVSKLLDGSYVSQFSFYETNQINPIEFQPYSNERKPVQIIKKEEKNREVVSLPEKISFSNTPSSFKSEKQQIPIFYNEYNKSSPVSNEKQQIPIILNGNKPSTLFNKTDDNNFSEITNEFFQPSVSLTENKRPIPIILNENKPSSLMTNFETRDSFDALSSNEFYHQPSTLRLNENNSLLFSKHNHSPILNDVVHNQSNSTERQHVPIAGKIFSEFKPTAKNVVKPSSSSLSFPNNNSYFNASNLNEHSTKEFTVSFIDRLEKSEQELKVIDQTSEKATNDFKETNKGSSVYYQIINLLDSYDQNIENNSDFNQNNNISQIPNSDNRNTYIIDKNDNAIFMPSSLTRPITEDKQFYQKLLTPKSQQKGAEIAPNSSSQSPSMSVYSQISNLLEDYFKSNEFSLSQLNSHIENNPNKNVSYKQNKNSNNFVQHGNLSQYQQENSLNKKLSLHTTPTSSISSSRSVYSEISDLLDLYLIPEDVPDYTVHNKFTDNIESFNN
jgi:hypothetical protein